MAATLIPDPTPIANLIKFVNCCTGQEIFFRGSLPFVNGDVVTYIGTTPFPGAGGSLEPTTGEFGICYIFYSGYVDSIPPYPAIDPVASLFSLILDGCEDAKCSCDVEISQCYMIIPCDGTEPIISNNSAFETYLNSFITVDSEVYAGCAYITALRYTDCSEAIAIEPIDIPCECDLICYYVANTNGFFYVDSDNVLQNVSLANAQPYLKVCSKIPPIAEDGSISPQIIDLGLCVEGLCLIQCFKLTNCKNSDLVIYTTSNSVIPNVYGTNNVVNILGREGCWIASELDDEEECDCPIDVTVTASFKDCEECIGVIAYKLTSCTDGSTIHTYSDLEVYIGQVVKNDCDCYLVEKVNYNPVSPQVIEIDNNYPNCVTCLRTYYKLTDCENAENIVITYSDLAQYVGGVIKVEGCTECWSVENTEDYLNAIEVTVTTDYVSCSDCKVLTCNCTKVTNLNAVVTVYSYFDCDNILHEISLVPGQSSDKVCATEWFLGDIENPIEFTVYDYFETFGECKFGNCPPPVFKNNRTVKPGYNTPNCNPDEYDKITCRFADVVYKQVLEKRYGISNCCPDEDEKWLMKKELIDLQSLKDPNYKCPSCPCSCNSGKSCLTCKCGN